jgi:hypothetical protein
MAEGGLGHVGGEVGLDVLAAVAEHARDLQPGGIGQRVQHPGDGDLLGQAVVQRAHRLILPPMIDD